MPAGQAATLLDTVAHELRQPLSNIESIAYYLSLVLPGDDKKVQEHLSRIRQLVDQSNWILSSGLRLSCTPEVAPKPMSLEELITHVVSANALDASLVRMEFADELPLVHLDPQHGAAMIETLLRSVLPVASRAHPLALRLSAVPEGVRMELEPHTDPPQTSLGAGAALALECAAQIAAAHGGHLCQETGGAGGIRVVVVLP